MRRMIGPMVVAAVVALASPAYCDGDQWQNRTEAEDHARELDHRVVELQHAIRAARYKGNQEDLERAETDLKNVQAERVDVLRALGALR